MIFDYNEISSVLSDFLLGCTVDDRKSPENELREKGIGYADFNHEKDHFFYFRGLNFEGSISLCLESAGGGTKDFSKIGYYLRQILDRNLSLEELSRHFSNGIRVEYKNDVLNLRHGSPGKENRICLLPKRNI